SGGSGGVPRWRRGGGGGLELGGAGVLLVGGEVGPVGGGQVGVVPQDQQVLGVLVLGLVGEVKAARHDRVPVDHHHLVVGDGVVRVDQGGQLLLEEKVQVGVDLVLVAVVEDDLDVDAARLGLDQGLGDGLGRERVRQHQHLAPGSLQLGDDHLGAAALG